MLKSIFIAAALAAAAPAFAGTVDATGTGQGTSTATAMPVAEGLVVVHATSDYTGFDGNSENPLASAKGPCFGSIMIDKGAVSGGGHCVYSDADGETAIIRWVADGISAEGRTQGDWSVAGGTGKWTAITGGGRFDAGVDGAGVYTNNVTGELTVP